MNISKLLIIITILLCSIQILFVLSNALYFSKKYFFTKEIQLNKRYGNNSWVLITGCSAGQGKRFAIEFAKRNFNIILIGRKGIKNVEKIIKNKYNVKTITYIANFNNAYKLDFFNGIENILNNLDGELSFLVNNIGHRMAWNPYHKMPIKKIRDTIICGTMVQSRMTQIAINHFLTKKSNHKSCIINITAQCQNLSFFFGTPTWISVPYMSVYEGSNAFGFYHSNSIEMEYKDMIDVLNITPGPVITGNTKYLNSIPFSIYCKSYVENIFTLIGYYTGPQHAYWKHELSGFISNIPLIDIYKKFAMFNIGNLLANNFMNKKKV